MQDARKFQLNIFTAIITLALAPLHALAGNAVFDLKTFQQYSRIIIPALPATSITATQKGGTITVDMSRVSDLSHFDVAGLKDSRVNGISLDMTGSDSAKVNIALTSENADFFAYAQPEPAAIVVDIWKKKSAEAPRIAAVPKRSKKEKKRSIASAAKKPVKAAAQVKVLPLDEKKDLFFRMVVPVPPLELSGGIVELPGKLEIAHTWAFATPDKKDSDGEAYGLAQALFKEKKYGLTIRTVELIHRDFPTSKYLQEADFLRALALKKLGEEQKSDMLVQQAERSLLEQATKLDENGKNAPFYKVVHYYFAMKEYQSKNWFKAAERLEYLLSIWSKKDPEYIDLQMILAETYMKVQRPRYAERIYRYILENESANPLAAEAAYRIADLLSTEKNYDRTIEEGLKALKLYPKHKKFRSELLFNIGEAYFWKKDYKNSAKFFNDFLAVSPAATIAAQAYARLGEIEEVAHRNLQAAEDQYMRAKNGFPFTLGDQIASLRLARIRLAGETDLSYQIASLESVYQDKEASDVIHHLAQLALIDYYLVAKKVDRAVKLAKEGFVENTGIAYEAFRKAYARSLLEQIKDRNQNGNFAEALKIYDQNQSLVAMNGPETLLVVAATYRGLGLFQTSNQYLAQYEQEVRAGRVTASVGEKVSLVEERAENGFRRGDYHAVLDELKSAPETAHVLAMRAMSLYRVGRKNEAYADAKRAFPALSENRLKMDKAAFLKWYPDIADLLVEQAINDRDYDNLQKIVDSTRKNLPEAIERYEFFAGDAFWYKREHQAAVDAYKAAIAKFPDGERADRAKYNSAMSLIELKKRDEAVKLLTEVQEKQRGVWSQSAKEELDLLEWEKKYATVLRGLPPSGLGVVQ